MSVFSDENTSKNVTEVLDPNGNLLLRISREYGEAIPANEALVIEQKLIELAASLVKSA